MMKVTAEALEDESSAMDINKTWRGLLYLFGSNDIQFDLPVLKRGDLLKPRFNRGIAKNKPWRLHPFLRQTDKTLTDRRCELVIRKEFPVDGVFCLFQCLALLSFAGIMCSCDDCFQYEQRRRNHRRHGDGIIFAGRK